MLEKGTKRVMSSYMWNKGKIDQALQMISISVAITNEVHKADSYLSGSFIFRIDKDELAP